jgi:hypothetical protein
VSDQTDADKPILSSHSGAAESQAGDRVSKWLAYHHALEPSGNTIVVNLRGAEFRLGREIADHLPVLFRLPDGRFFYGRYSQEGFRPFRFDPRATLVQLSGEDAVIQAETDQIPLWREDHPPRLVPPGSPAPVDPLLETIQMLGSASLQITLVRFLAQREEQSAELRTINKEVRNGRPSKAHIKTTRRMVQRAQANLDAKQCPLRLRLVGDVVVLFSVNVDPK